MAMVRVCDVCGKNTHEKYYILAVSYLGKTTENVEICVDCYRNGKEFLEKKSAKQCKNLLDAINL